MKKIVALVAMAALTSSVLGAQFFVRDGRTDFDNPECYYLAWNKSNIATTLPGPNDSVLLQPNAEYELDGTSAAFKALVKAGHVWFCMSNDSVAGQRMTVSVPKGATVTMDCTFDGYVWGTNNKTVDAGMRCWLVKKGEGTLEFSEKSWINRLWEGPRCPVYVCLPNIDIQEGTLQLPVGDSVGELYYSTVSIAKGATLALPKSKQMAISNFHRLINPKGSFIANYSDKAQPIGSFSFTDEHKRMVIEANFRCAESDEYGPVYIWSKEDIELKENVISSQRGSQNTVLDGATLYLPGLGGSGWTPEDEWPKSPIGKTYNFDIGVSKLGLGGKFVYTGKGEKTKTFIKTSTYSVKADGSSADPVIIDGGAEGGLVMEADNTMTYFGPYVHSWYFGMPPSASAYGVFRIVLTGDNKNECVLVQPMNLVTDADGKEYPAYLNKDGKGTWRLSDPKFHESGHVGVTQISDGTLKFDSIAEINEPCSLGYSTNLRPDDSRALNEEYFDPSEAYVDYAFLLGSDDSHGEPVFEYSGDGAATCTSRPLALAGNGGTLKASNGPLTFADISAKDENQKTTIKLDGEGLNNSVSNIRDGKYGAQVSVEKNGSGIWTLTGDNDFTGRLNVREGRMQLRVPENSVGTQPFKWYRLSIAQVGAEDDAGKEGWAAGANASLRKICLYSEDGTCQSFGLEAANEAESGTKVTKATAIAPGQCAWDDSMAGRTKRGSGLLASLFREQDTASYDDNCCDIMFSSVSDGWGRADPTVNTPQNWYRIIMHLGDDAEPITHFDLRANTKENGMMPTHLKLEGSLDGSSWTTVWDNIYGDDIDWGEEKYSRWMGEPTVNDTSRYTLAYDESYYYNAMETGAIPYYRYSYFRLSIAQIGDAGYARNQSGPTGQDAYKWDGNDPKTGLPYQFGGVAWLRHICLYDADGVCQSRGLKAINDVDNNKAVASFRALQPGEVAWDSTMIGRWKRASTGGSSLESLFNDVFSGSGAGECKMCFTVADYDSWKRYDPTVSVPDAWYSIVMRLPERAPAITHFDIQTMANLNGYMPTRMKLEGSTDGIVWSEVWSNIDGDEIDWGAEKYNRWMSDPTATGNAHESLAYDEFSPFNLWRSGFWADEVEDWFSLNDAMEGFSVLDGATLAATHRYELANFVIDASAGDCGTLENFALVPGGLITLKNVPPMGARIHLPLLDNCEGDFNDWNLVVEGYPEGFDARIKGDYVVVESNRPGMIILIK